MYGTQVCIGQVVIVFWWMNPIDLVSRKCSKRHGDPTGWVVDCSVGVAGYSEFALRLIWRRGISTSV